MEVETAGTVIPVALAAAREAKVEVQNPGPQASRHTRPLRSTQEIRRTTHDEGADQGHGLHRKITIDHDHRRHHRHRGHHPRHWWTTEVSSKGTQLGLWLLALQDRENVN